MSQKQWDDFPLWYIRLNVGFFNKSVIQDIKKLPDHGICFPQFVICLYGELVLYAAPTNGMIEFPFRLWGENTLDYIVAKRFDYLDKKELVKKALEILKEKNLILIGRMNAGEENDGYGIYCPAVEENTGKVKLSSEKRRKQRLAARKQLTGEAAEVMETGELLEGGEKSVYGLMNNVFLYPDEYDSLTEAVGEKEFAEILRTYANEKEVAKDLGKEVNDDNDYAELLKRCKEVR